MIEFVINRLGRVGVNVVLIDVIKHPVFFLKASLKTQKGLKLVTHFVEDGGMTHKTQTYQYKFRFVFPWMLHSVFISAGDTNYE